MIDEKLTYRCLAQDRENFTTHALELSQSCARSLGHYYAGLQNDEALSLVKFGRWKTTYVNAFYFNACIHSVRISGTYWGLTMMDKEASGEWPMGMQDLYNRNGNFVTVFMTICVCKIHHNHFNNSLLVDMHTYSGSLHTRPSSWIGIMSPMASQITGVSIVCSTVCLDADQRKLSSASLACVRGIHRWPVDSPHKGPVTRKMFPFDDVIMTSTSDSFCACRDLSCHKPVWVTTRPDVCMEPD